MPHIAIVPSLLTGRLFSSFELASRLQREGHTITFLSQHPTLDKIKDNGFSYVAVPTIDFKYKYPQRPGETASWFKKFILHYTQRKDRYKMGIDHLNFEVYKKITKQVDPDLILVDTELHDFIFTSWELNIPIVLFTTWFSDTISLKNPSIRTDIIPGHGLSGSAVGIFWSWFLMRSKIYGRVLVNRLKLEHYRRWVFIQYARKIGFDRNGLLINTLPPLYSFTQLPILSLTMSELEFPHRKAGNIRYVGPMVHEKRMDKTPLSGNSPMLVGNLKSMVEQGNKIIYCSVGSLAKGYLPFIKNVIEAVSQEANWNLLLSIGPKMDQNDFIGLPSNVHVFNWVNQLEVLKYANCCITHCGINSINECIHHRVPMLLYSGKYTDENGNAARLAYHGLGIRGDIGKDSSVTIKRKLEEVLSDTTFKTKLDHFHSIYLDYRAQALSPLLFAY